jgi:NADH-quinone oxidoreductase subunit M
MNGRLDLSAPWEALIVCSVLLFAPALAASRSTSALQRIMLGAALVMTLFAPTGVLAYTAAALGALVHAAGAWPRTRTGSLGLALAAVVTLGAAAALATDRLTAAFVLSSLAVALRAGVVPFHVGVAALCERAPVVQTEQLASTIALVFVHLRFVDHHAGAIALAPLLVRYGATACVIGALMSLVQRDLRGLYRGTTAMHGGMLLAGVGTASLGNFAAALLVAVAMGLALGGLGLIITSLEDRVGRVVFSGPGGLARTFPRLASGYALFGGAGVGLPGTAGFVADDLLLHTLWMESPASTVTVIVSSAMLAVATLASFSKVFLGRTTESLAPDLHVRERVVLVVLLLGLVTLGVVPWVLLGPADAFLSGSPP